jgi:hypothetical protein
MRKIVYEESCYECFSLDLDIKYLGHTAENEDHERIRVTCRLCGETWEDLLDD